MRYSCYTDAAYNFDTNESGLAYVIMTEYDFINADSYQTNTASSIYEAEILAIGLALAYVQSNIKLKESDNIEILSDSREAIKTYELFLSNKVRPEQYTKEIQNSLKYAKRLSEICELSFVKEHAHKNKLNVNTLVDRFAKLAIRS